MNKKILSQITGASIYRYPYQNLSLVDMSGEIWKEMAIRNIKEGMMIPCDIAGFSKSRRYEKCK